MYSIAVGSLFTAMVLNTRQDGQSCRSCVLWSPRKDSSKIHAFRAVNARTLLSLPSPCKDEQPKACFLTTEVEDTTSELGAMKVGQQKDLRLAEA